MHDIKPHNTYLIAIRPGCEQMQVARSDELRHGVGVGQGTDGALLAPLTSTELALRVSVAVLFCRGQDRLHGGAAEGRAHASIADVQVEALLRGVLAVAKAKAALGAKRALEKLGRLCRRCGGDTAGTSVEQHLDVAHGAPAAGTCRGGHLVGWMCWLLVSAAVDVEQQDYCAPLQAVGWHSVRNAMPIVVGSCWRWYHLGTWSTARKEGKPLLQR